GAQPTPAAGSASRTGCAGVVVLGRGPDVRPDGVAARGPAPGAAVGDRRAADEAGVAVAAAAAPGRRRNLRLRSRPPVGAAAAATRSFPHAYAGKAPPFPRRPARKRGF